MIDEFLIPERLEDTIGEAERQEVLHGFLAHIVVNTIDLILTEDTAKFAI